MRLILYNFTLFILFFVLFPVSVHAATTPFRTAGAITSDGHLPFINLENCTVTDGKTCDRGTGSLAGTLYFRDFGSYSDFGIPTGSTITRVRIRVSGKAKVPALSIYAGLSIDPRNSFNCQFPSDLWALRNLNSNTIQTQMFATNVTEHGGYWGTVNGFCLNSNNFEKMRWRINYSSYVGYIWSASIDNLEIAFDYEITPIPTPTPTITPTPPPAKTPLVLIPGMAGSEFKVDQVFESEIKDCGTSSPFTYNIDDIVWLDVVEAVTSRCDDYFDILKLNSDGQSPLFSQAVLNGTFVPLAYGEFVDFFKNNGYELNKTLFLFPYDWRKDIALTKILLDQKIEFIKQQAGGEKVDIVAHSMGGLVARNYISDVVSAEKVRKLITLGAPYLGATEFINNLMYGGCMSHDWFKKPICLGVSPSEVKDMAQNLTSGFELSPSKTYFDFYSGEDNLHPLPFRDDKDLDKNGVTGPLNYSQTKNLLTNLGYNTSLFTPSEAFHNLDQNLTGTNNVKVSIVVGSGQKTLGQIIEKYRINLAGIKLSKTDRHIINGDDTVPLLSAAISDPHKNLSLLGTADLYYSNQKHGELVENGPALELTKNILFNEDPILPEYIARQPFKMKGHELSVHSPVDLHVYDQYGNHTGPTLDGEFEANIPGSSYETLGDAKFVWLPDDGAYNIELIATGAGSFDFKIRKFEEDLNSQTILYNDIPLTASTRVSAVFDTQSPEAPVLELDENGDGVVDSNVNPFSILEGDENYDNIPPTISLDVSPKIIWPISNKTIDINVTGQVADENPYITKIQVDDEYDLIEPLISISQDQINQAIQLEASRRGDDKDGRKYTIKVLATDLAGNTSFTSFEVIVPHDERKEKL